MLSKDKEITSNDKLREQTVSNVLQAGSYGGCCDSGVQFGLFDNGTDKVIERSKPSVAKLMTKPRSNSGSFFGFMERVFSGDKAVDAESKTAFAEDESKAVSLRQPLL